MRANETSGLRQAPSLQKVLHGLDSLLWPLLALGALLLFNFLFTPGFFQVTVQQGHLYGSLIDVIHRGAPVMLLALGMTLVIATGGVDLSVGAVTAISGAVAALMLAPGGGDAGMAGMIAVALLASLLAGAWNAVLVALMGVQPIVATLILMVAGRGIAQLLTGGQILTIAHPDFRSMGGGFFLGLPITVLWVALASLVTWALVRATAMGLFIEAVGGSPVASRYAGVPTRSVLSFVYLFAALCAGFAGLLIASDIGAADVNNSGLYLELDAILAVVIGGTALQGGRFSLAGSIIGSLVIQTVTTTIHTRGVPVQWNLVIKAIVVLLVCLLQSEALRQRFKSRFKTVAPLAALSRKGAA